MEQPDPLRVASGNVAPQGCELGEASVYSSAHAVLPAVAYNVRHTQGPLKEDL
jgi:hypothetical protein